MAGAGLSGAFPGTGAQVQLIKKFFVAEITADGFAIGKDSFAKDMKVALNNYPRGALPAAGETWLLTRIYGGSWAWGICIKSNPPSITGTTTDPVVKNLVSALAAMGLITNKTT